MSMHDYDISLFYEKTFFFQVHKMCSMFNFPVKPAFNVKPHDQVVGVRRTVTMHCSVIGIPQPTIIWSKTSSKPSGEKVTITFQIWLRKIVEL